MGRQEPHKNKKGLGSKPKFKKSVSTCHRVQYDCGSMTRSKSGNNVSREEITKLNLDETTKFKAKRTFRKVSREGIPSENIVNPRSSNMY